MKSSTFLGSTLGVLLAFSVISYARITQKQEPKPATIQQPAAPDVAGQEPELREAATSVPSTNSNAAPLPVNASSLAPPNSKAVASDFIVGPQTYSATAYSLRGRTASGRPVSRGLIAADPAILPLGTRVRVEAGTFSGEYVVADTGGAVRGRRIDIWTPTAREAMRFGRRAVKLTVLEFGGKRGKQAATQLRLTNPATPAKSAAVQPTVQAPK